MQNTVLINDVVSSAQGSRYDMVNYNTIFHTDCIEYRVMIDHVKTKQLKKKKLGFLHGL